MKRPLFRFVLVGGLNTALNYVLFAGMIAAGVHHLAAATLAWGVGVLVSFLLNKRFTFDVRTPADLREVGSFVTGCGLQLLLGLAGYAVLIDGLGLGATPAFLINLPIVAGFSYVFMQRAVFRPRPSAG